MLATLALVSLPASLLGGCFRPMLAEGGASAGLIGTGRRTRLRFAPDGSISLAAFPLTPARATSARAWQMLAVIAR
jgi:hypothetical protein